MATLDDCGADESIARFRTKTPQVAVVSFTKSGLKVMGYGYDRNFGGRNFDEVRNTAVLHAFICLQLMVGTDA